MTLSYEDILKKAWGRINDPTELSLEKNDLLELHVERLHNVLGRPNVRRLFSSINLDDDFEEMELELVNPIDDSSDQEFICEIFVLGLQIEWLQPQITSIKYTLMFGGKEEKKLLDPRGQTMTLNDSLNNRLDKMIRNHGILYNSYINSES